MYIGTMVQEAQRITCSSFTYICRRSINIGSQPYTKYTHQLQTAPIMMLLTFILVLSMSVAAQSAAHAPNDNNYCSYNIEEFRKNLEEYCSEWQAKRYVLEENGMTAHRVDSII